MTVRPLLACLFPASDEDAIGPLRTDAKNRRESNTYVVLLRKAQCLCTSPPPTF